MRAGHVISWPNANDIVEVKLGFETQWGFQMVVVWLTEHTWRDIALEEGLKLYRISQTFWNGTFCMTKCLRVRTQTIKLRLADLVSAVFSLGVSRHLMQTFAVQVTEYETPRWSRKVHQILVASWFQIEQGCNCWGSRKVEESKEDQCQPCIMTPEYVVHLLWG